MRIAVLAAMPGEHRPFRRLLGTPQKTASAPRPLWSGTISGKEILVLETGIGRRHAAEAARCLVARYPLDLMLSAGFAGGLSPDLRVGDVVWSREVATHDAAADRIRLEYRCATAPALEDALAGLGARPGRFVTVEHVQPNRLLAAKTGDTTAVLEMESADVAAVAHRHGIPFFGLRTFSDTAAQDIDLDLDALLNGRGRVSIPRAAATVLRRPSLLLSFRRWEADSRIAGDALAHFLVAMLQLPEDDLRSPVLTSAPN